MTTATKGSTSIKIRTTKQWQAFIRKEMRSQGLSTAVLAEMAGLSWPTVHNNIQEWVKRPQFRTLKNMSHALGYDITLKASKSRGSLEIE